MSVRLHRLTMVAERDGVMVGRPDTGSYAMFPAEGAETLRQLGAGKPVDEVAAWYESECGTPLDFDDFFEVLDELGFLVPEDADAPVVAAWANRAVLAFTTGRPLQVVDDLTEAIRLADDGMLRVNRAIALQELGNHRQAVRDLDAALAAGADDPDLLYLRGVSRQAVGDDAGARADWEAHLAAYGDEISPHAVRIAESVA